MNATIPPLSGNDGLYIFVGVFVLLILLSIYRRREFLLQRLRWAFLMLGTFFLVVFVLRQYTQDPVKIVLAALFAEFVIGTYTRPRRTRYIPRRERRKAIARYERHGKRFDPKRHHLDHVVPYSKGGSNQADNLRVKDKDENLAKSDRSPWWDVFGRT